MGSAKREACFSNWVYRSSSILSIRGRCDRLSGSRFSSQSDLAFQGRRCLYVSDWLWRALLPGALHVAQQTCSSSSTDLVWIGASRQVDWLAF